MRLLRRSAIFLTVAVLFLMPLLAQGSTDFDFSILEKSVVETTLDNGLKIIILPRHDAPVVSFVTWANVGGSDDPKEYSGLAHMFEHMAFKGTDTIGSRNPSKELELMNKEDEIFLKLRSERLKGRLANNQVIASLTAEMEKAIAEAYSLVEPNEFANRLEKEGGAELNAFTSRDQTAYIVSLPSNKIEFWMAMESERFLAPRLREMYREREVVAEERRMTVDNRPVGKLVEDFLVTAFKAHPYGLPIVGHMSDIQNYSRKAAQAFFDRYYSPGNLTVAIVGDVKPEETIELAKKYWGRIAARELPEPLATIEPEQTGERRVTIEERAQPALLMGWHVPAETHADTPALRAFIDILGQGRTSRLYKRMIKDLKVAVSISAFTGWPGNKYPSLAVIFAFPSQGKSNQECEQIIVEEVEKLKKELLTNEDLEKVKARAMSAFIGELRSNMGLAQNLATYQQLWGDWRALFRELGRINAVTPQDVQRVAKQYFVNSNRTIASMETITEATESADEKECPCKSSKKGAGK
ncbi:MAG: insulinase family protein [Erysipelotrichia bacterium]|nr:pitrilysin family protein [Candidatus Riflebacteria bacterium]NCB39833.1 insulinase family protein [Erysipelotrichia bacterium]